MPLPRGQVVWGHLDPGCTQQPWQHLAASQLVSALPFCPQIQIAVVSEHVYFVWHVSYGKYVEKEAK